MYFSNVKSTNAALLSDQVAVQSSTVAQREGHQRMLPLALRQQRRTHKKSGKSDPFGSHHQPQKQQQRKPSTFRRKVKLESP
jgi:hypothetical protein